jgi:hypothetical protein
MILFFGFQALFQLTRYEDLRRALFSIVSNTLSFLGFCRSELRNGLFF